MVDLLKIEWSGYWDFPNGTYSGGSRDGFPLSGEFPTELIILDSVSGINYEIDPGKPTFPKSPSASFQLKNRHNETGIEIYPYKKLSKLGRLVEYGGHDDNFADLFVKITSPLLNNKVLFKGKVESVKYTIYENEVTINCTDFIGGLSNTKRELFNKYSFKEMDVYPNEHPDFSPGNLGQSSIMNEFFGITDTLKDHNGNDLEIQRIYFSDRFRDYNNPTADPNTWDETDLANDASFQSYMNDVINSASSSNSLLERVFKDNLDWADLEFSYNYLDERDQDDTGNKRWAVGINTPTRYVFLQVGKDTILSPCKYDLYIETVEEYVTGSSMRSYTKVAFTLRTIHMNNGNVEIDYVSDEANKLVIFERGRFLKDEENPTDAEYNSDDTSENYPDVAEVTVYDYSFYPVENQPFIIKDGWEQFSESTLADFSTDIIVSGFYFEHDSANNQVIPRENAGYFNNVESLIYALGNNLLDEFSYTPSSGNLFDTSKLDYSKHSHCYLSDAVHYGWIGKSFPEVLIGTARQISSYIFTREDGLIILQNRDHYLNSDVTTDPGFYKLEPEFFQQISPKDFDFGSQFYKIEYADLIEINNLQSEDKFDEIVNNNGIASSFASPQKLEVENYRTTDLGVPDKKTREAIENNDSDFNLLRTPIGGNNPSEDFFLQTPVNQAIKYAESLPYPSEVFTVAVDVLKGSALNYADISIGDYLYRERQVVVINESDEAVDAVERTIYLVKIINYNLSEVLKSATPVKMGLIYVGTETEVL